MPQCLAVAIALASFACTEAGLTPDSFELDEDAPLLEAHAGYEHQPEAPAALPDPSVQPQLWLRRVALSEYERELELCPYLVESRGFPAISADGSTIVTLALGPIGNGEADIETLYVKRFDFDEALGERTDLIYDRGTDHPWKDDFAGCEASIAAVLATVQRLDAELGEQDWRPLEPLPVVISDPDNVELSPYVDQAMDHLAPSERPVELRYHAGSFIARIRGVEVLQRTPRPEWRQWSDEFSDNSPHLEAVQVDRVTGRALVSFNYSNHGCLSDDATYFSAIELAPAVLDAVDRKPTAAFEEELIRFEVFDYP
ncbi:hypothetical protein DB30_07678 [Enhygromyxa salina]|uniref:Uncharacterized protein n=1 Tax=Enhygromyxa salina TaxID=215803 RepID=A0A0C2A5E4_9BACT|nr:hypothetical protein DB30_07678 [Enhygromyxa salina]